MRLLKSLHELLSLLTTLSFLRHVGSEFNNIFTR